MQRNICLRFGDIEIAGTLNDSETACAFFDKLPLQLRVCGCGVDYCGRMPFCLPYKQEQVHRGWANGDINYNPGGGWFAILFADEENSMRYGDQVNLGKVNGRLDALQALSGACDLVVEQA